MIGICHPLAFLRSVPSSSQRPPNNSQHLAILSRRNAPLLLGQQGSVDPVGEQVAGHDVVGQAYAYADELIGLLTRQADERCLVILVSDHGFVTGRRADSPNISGVHWNAAPPGVIVMAGAGIAPGTQLDRGSVVDLAPTILHAMGLPVARDMDGRVASVIEQLGGPPVQQLDSYEGEARSVDAVPIPSGHDEAIIERLKALGYLGDE